jgi:leucyl aminopeptidase
VSQNKTITKGKNMKFVLKTSSPKPNNESCLVLAVNDKSLGKSAAQYLSNSEHEFLKRKLEEGILSEAFGEFSCIHPISEKSHHAILLLQCGKSKQIKGEKLTALFKNLSNQLLNIGKEAVIPLALFNQTANTNKALLRQLILQIGSSAYEFNDYRTQHKTHSLQNVTITGITDKQRKDLTLILKQSSAIVSGMTLTRNLANTPPNVCTPTHMATQAKLLAKNSQKLSVTILSEEKMRALKMGALLSVSQGSPEPAKTICFHYQGGKKTQKPIVFVGKGVTFDTGGNSLKPPGAMIGMKYDMCGGATVFGLIQFAIELNLPLNIVGLVGAVENTPGGAASRPEDIVTSMSGKTIEILNTDAEGRLVLCDLLTYAKKYKPQYVVDIATLTGAIVVALGAEISGLMGNDQNLLDKLVSASKSSHDKTCPLPLEKKYKDEMKSHFADLKNIGNGGAAGSLTAGGFLSYFTEDFPWAHLDIAGVATSGKNGALRGTATGRPVPLLAQFLLDQLKKK